MIFNLPNIITIARILLVPFFVFFLFGNNYVYLLIALAIFILAAITDYIDGRLARNRKMITRFGQLMDPIADKILVLSAFISFIQIDKSLFPYWMVVIIFIREFVITTMRVGILDSANANISANIWGKVKTVIQMFTIIYSLLFLIARGYLSHHLNVSHNLVWSRVMANKIIAYIIAKSPLILLSMATIITLLSGIIYFVSYYRIYKDEG